MPITGVTPLPPVRKSALAGGVAGRAKSPVAWSRWMRVPGCRARTTWLLTVPSGMALTQMESRPSGASASEVSE